MLQLMPCPGALSPAWQDKLIQGYEDDPEAKQLLLELVVSSPDNKGFSLQDGIIRFQG